MLSQLASSACPFTGGDIIALITPAVMYMYSRPAYCQWATWLHTLPDLSTLKWVLCEVVAEQKF